MSHSIRQLLAQPLVALFLGSLSGVGLAAITRLGIRYFTPENELLGPMLVAVTTFGGMVVAIGAMYGYSVVAESAFAWFGITLVAAFLVAVTVGVVRSGVLKEPGEGGS